MGLVQIWGREKPTKGKGGREAKKSKGAVNSEKGKINLPPPTFATFALHICPGTRRWTPIIHLRHQPTSRTSLPDTTRSRTVLYATSRERSWTD